MGYGYKTRIGYHEVTPDRKLSLPGLIDRLQDCGGFHGDDCGYSNKGLADDGLAWILASWQIVITGGWPDLSEWVWLETIPYKHRFFLANRYFILRSLDNREYARADSVWILMDMKEYKPVKIPPEMAEAYAAAGSEDIFKGFDFGGRKIENNGEFQKLQGVEVTPYMIDTNRHVNNDEYVKITQSYLPEGYRWNTFRAEYTKQARMGDIMIPAISEENGSCRIALLDKEGEQFFIGEWSERELPA